MRLLWHDYRYFPYERALARREVLALFRSELTEDDDGFCVTGAVNDSALNRLTYFKAIETSNGLLIPDQARLEASGNGRARTLESLRTVVPSLRRQCTRYSTHGLHEYRGKFNPQVVRSIGNLFGLKEGSWVLDPFCGSGTTLLEAAHIGWNAVGIDINPLGVLIANAKVGAFRTSSKVLLREYESLEQRLSKDADDVQWRKYLPEPDYLQLWFPIPVLEQLSRILQAIDITRPKRVRDMFRVALSDVCRNVSWQDPQDLRIRRRKEPAPTYPAIEIFLTSLQRKITSVVRAREQVRPRQCIHQIAVLGDSRVAVNEVQNVLRTRRRTLFDAVITSPPYATAMPYLDTQRLSLALLGLISSGNLRSKERMLIGNREIQGRERTRLEMELGRNSAQLPPRAIKFCRELLVMADDDSHGFRRRNVPGLVYKYLCDMAESFSSVRRLTKRGGQYGLLVGRNATRLRGQDILIDTPYLLAELATMHGWKVEELIAFDTYHRYDLHQKNSIREERLLILRKC